MSTDILETDAFSVTRFFGGTSRGVCYQISAAGSPGYVQLTRDDAELLRSTLAVELSGAPSEATPSKENARPGKSYFEKMRDAITPEMSNKIVREVEERFRPAPEVPIAPSKENAPTRTLAERGLTLEPELAVRAIYEPAPVPEVQGTPRSLGKLIHEASAQNGEEFVVTSEEFEIMCAATPGPQPVGAMIFCGKKLRVGTPQKETPPEGFCEHGILRSAAITCLTCMAKKAVPEGAQGMPEKCPKCGGDIDSGGHGPWCPKPTCKWGWEVEMDGSPLKAPEGVQGKEPQAYEQWLKTVPRCIGGESGGEGDLGCDGDLVGTTHEEDCPMHRVPDSAGRNFGAGLQDAFAAGQVSGGAAGRRSAITELQGWMKNCCDLQNAEALMILAKCSELLEKTKP